MLRTNEGIRSRTKTALPTRVQTMLPSVEALLTVFSAPAAASLKVPPRATSWRTVPPKNQVRIIPECTIIAGPRCVTSWFLAPITRARSRARRVSSRDVTSAGEADRKTVPTRSRTRAATAIPSEPRGQSAVRRVATTRPQPARNLDADAHTVSVDRFILWSSYSSPGLRSLGSIVKSRHAITATGTITSV